MTCSEVSLRQTFVHVTLDYKKWLWTFSFFLLNDPPGLLWSLREEWRGRSSAGIPAVVILGTRSHRLQSRAWHGTTAAHSWAHGSTEGSQNMLAWARESFGLSRVTCENSKVIFHTFYHLGWTLFHVQCRRSSCSPCNNQAPIIIHTSMGRQTPLWFHTLLHSEMRRLNSLRNTEFVWHSQHYHKTASLLRLVFSFRSTPVLAE